MTVISPYHRLEKKKRKNNTSKSGDHASQWVFFKRGHEPYGFLAANVPIVRGKKKKRMRRRAILTPSEFVVVLTGFLATFSPITRKFVT